MNGSDPKGEAETTAALEAAAEPPSHHGLGSRLRNYFLTGLVVAGPVAVTLYLIWSFVTWVDGMVRPFIPAAYRPDSYLPIYVPGTGLIIAFLALTLLGFLTANLVGRTLVELGEGIMNRMPIVRPIYRMMKQIFEALFSKSGSTFRRVGLVEFPAPGMWSLVFLSAPPAPDISERLPSKEEHVSVFMPCTPNPTTGFFFYVPRREIIELDIPVEAAAKVIMTAGLLQPEAGSAKRLAALAEVARTAKAARASEAAE